MVCITSFGFAFYICPMEAELEQKRNSVRKMKEELNLLISKYDLKEEERKLVREKDPEIMERMVREEFNLIDKQTETQQ